MLELNLCDKTALIIMLVFSSRALHIFTVGYENNWSRVYLIEGKITTNCYKHKYVYNETVADIDINPLACGSPATVPMLSTD